MKWFIESMKRTIASFIARSDNLTPEKSNDTLKLLFRVFYLKAKQKTEPGQLGLSFV
ncbi:hypothetical protein GCM10011573_14750 [Enterococcus wangshanyuanii]|uniref:Transposase n=1 Tax=Enterococcus wangshanyuanii TaxID=2005703 RepID=A0ABQ1NWZ9_9ENTE|nr:hypothetical protein GCM10011573_14750 [Enterococcus wangshanyuanii]